MVSTRGVRYKFTEGERVLCYEPDPTKAKVLYDSKVLEVIESKDKRGRRTVEYLIHFQGWNSSWDRCVGEGFVLKDTEENRQLQRDLAEKSQLQLGAYLYRRERKKGSTSSAGAGPAKRSRQGFSDDGSSSSTQPDEPEGEAEGSGRSRDTGDTDSSGSGSAGTPPPHGPGRAHIQLPPALRDRLTFDYHLVVKRGRLSKLPASPCVAQILESYVKWYARAGAWHTPRARADPPQKPDLLDVSCRLNLVREIADGLRVYFDFILRGHLLYKQEKQQYYQLCGQYIDEKEETQVKEECDVSERSGSECTDEEMTSPLMAEYSHLPPDPDPGLLEEQDEEGPETPPPGHTIEMHRIIIIKKEIKEELDDQQEGVYQQELLIQMDIKEEQDSQDNREYYNQENQEYYHQEGYQEYEYQGEENQEDQVFENQEEQDDESQDQEDDSQDQEDSENQEGDEEEYDNEGSESQEDTQEDSQEYENDEDDNDNEYADRDDPEYEGEEDESSEEIEEEEEFEIELDEENYRNQMELRNQQREQGIMQQETLDNVTPSDVEQLQVIAERGQQIASDKAQKMEMDSNQHVASVTEMELRSGKHLDTTQGGKEKILLPEQSSTSSTYMTLRRGKQIASKEEDKHNEIKEIESIIQEPQEEESRTEVQITSKLETGKQLDTKQGKQASSKQIDKQADSESDVKQSTEKLIDTKQGDGHQMGVKHGSGKQTHSKRISGKQIDNEPESEKETSTAQVLEQQKSDKQMEVQDIPTIETRSAGKRKSGKQIDTLQEDDKPLSAIQISVRKGKGKLDTKESEDQTDTKNTSGKGGKGKHLDLKLDDGHNLKISVDKRRGKSKQIDVKQNEGQTAPKSSEGKGGKGKQLAVKQIEKEVCEKVASGKHMTLRQGSGKKSPVVEKEECKHVDTIQGSGKKLDEISDGKQIEGKKGSIKNVSSKQIEIKQSSGKHIEPLKGRGKQIFEYPEDDNDVQDLGRETTRGGKEMTLRPKGKELKHKGGKQLEILQTVDKQTENPKEDKEIGGKHVESKNVGAKEIKTKDTGEKNINLPKSSSKHPTGKRTSGKEIGPKESDEKHLIEPVEIRSEGKQTSAKEVTAKQVSGKKIEGKEASRKSEGKTSKTVEEKFTGKHVKTKETEEKRAELKVSGKQIEVKESDEIQCDVSETAVIQEIKDTNKLSDEEHIELVSEKQIKQEVESQDEEVKEDKEHERRSMRKRSEKHIDSQERKLKKRGKSMSETEDKMDIKEEPFDESKAIKLEVKEEREDSNDRAEMLSPLEEAAEADGGQGQARRSLPRRLRSHKSGVSQSENEEPLPSTSSTEPRAFEAVSSSVCSSGSSVSEGWRAPTAAPQPPTRTPLSLLLEKVAKWHIIPLEGTEHLPCRVYGAIHLARLFVKLPDFLNATQMPDHKLKLILKHIDMFVQFLEEHSEWFGEHYYYADSFGRTT